MNALFSFRTNCQECGEVVDFVAPFGSAIGNDIMFVVQCEECGSFQLVWMEREDFLALFCGGEE